MYSLEVANLEPFNYAMHNKCELFNLENYVKYDSYFKFSYKKIKSASY